MKSADGDDKLDIREVNTQFLINEIFEGDTHKALAVCRKYKNLMFRLAPMSIERSMILESLRDGASVDDIVDALSTDEHKINRGKVVRLKKELEAGKHG